MNFLFGVVSLELLLADALDELLELLLDELLDEDIELADSFFTLSSSILLFASFS